eukprot:CAMPEP_0178437046 /NCGR_PEP_ID=MMETSP0689_2-20121128/34761_1 /TAXON_ID=160604 /ORGANISM="Amphidinium massartii, Strain CS-259" /LENGTH=140 /DNA_ID=CAMNT_0020059177 /DNA_START=281 /DNA_END=703 /DNA_ORIENTATION=+
MVGWKLIHCRCERPYPALCVWNALRHLVATLLGLAHHVDSSKDLFIDRCLLVALLSIHEDVLNIGDGSCHRLPLRSSLAALRRLAVAPSSTSFGTSGRSLRSAGQAMVLAPARTTGYSSYGRWQADSLVLVSARPAPSKV